MSLFSSLLGSLGGKVVDAVSARSARKHTEKLRKLELEQVKHQTKLEAIARGQEMDNAWELEQIKNSGWKDEAVLCLVSVPVALCFHPDTVVYVQEGFAALENCPDWFRWLIICIYTAVFGIRVWRRQ